MPHKRAKKSVREQQRKGRGADLAPAPDNNSGNGMGISNERIPKSAARVLDAAKIRAEYKHKKRARMQMEGGTAPDDVNADDGHGGGHHTDGAPKKLPPLPPHKKRRTDAGAGAGAEKRGVLRAKEKGKGTEHHHLVDTQAIDIQPGESLKHFNRRVEEHMRPLVQSAMRASAATERKERKAAANTTSASHASTATTSTKKVSVKDAPAPTTARRKNDDDDDDDDDHRPKEFAVMSSTAPRRLNDIAMAPPELKKFPRGVKAKHNSQAAGSTGDKTKASAGVGAGVLSMAQRVMMEAERESAIKRYREMKERKAKETDRTHFTLAGGTRLGV